jgi:hypothetical protein
MALWHVSPCLALLQSYPRFDVLKQVAAWDIVHYYRQIVHCGENLRMIADAATVIQESGNHFV